MFNSLIFPFLRFLPFIFYQSYVNAVHSSMSVDALFTEWPLEAPGERRGEFPAAVKLQRAPSDDIFWKLNSKRGRKKIM